MTWLINALALQIMNGLIKDFNLGSFYEALVVSAALGLLNALIWPLLIRYALPITVLTLGFASIILNGAFVALAVNLLPDESVYIKNWQTGMIVAVGITVINALFTRLLSIDDDDFYYRNVIKRQAARQKSKSKDNTDKTGIVFLEIDGLAHEVLQRAIRGGWAPTMGRWLREGNYSLMSWECDWSSQTGAMQAGILHGNNWDMPAFRWYEKDLGKAIVSNIPKDAVEIERRHSDGKGLLHHDGASRANLLSGDAPHSMITLSTIRQKNRKGSLGQDYAAFFSNPYSALRTLIMVLGEVFTECRQQIIQKRRDIQPRVHRGFFPYPLLRAFTNVLQRELGISATIQDIFAGRPVIYTMFLGYDEVSHHSGTERPETMAELEKIDRAFRRLEIAIKDSMRPYKLVVLSDHGQTQGSTFKQRYGQSLDELISDLTAVKIKSSSQGDDGRSYANATAEEMKQAGGVTKLISKLLPHFKQDEEPTNGADVSVMASGALGSVSFIHEPGRLSLEKIDERYPNLIKKLIAHDGIGFILVRSENKGDLVIGKHGTRNLQSGVVKGRDPLLLFGPNAAEHVSRTSSFPHCPDIVINSTYWPETGEVAAFEELVGSHGAMGGPQQYPFILFPSEFKPPKETIVGAEKVHKQFRHWLVDLGWSSYKS